MSDVLRAADALADAAEALRDGTSSNRRANLTVALDAYRAARDAAPAPSGLPVVLASVDDVAVVCEAHGLVETDPSYGLRGWAGWAGAGDRVLVGAGADGWSLAVDGRAADLDYGLPAAVLVAAIEAARGAQT